MSIPPNEVCAVSFGSPKRLSWFLAHHLACARRPNFELGSRPSPSERWTARNWVSLGGELFPARQIHSEDQSTAWSSPACITRQVECGGLRSRTFPSRRHWRGGPWRVFLLLRTPRKARHDSRALPFSNSDLPGRLTVGCSHSFRWNGPSVRTWALRSRCSTTLCSPSGTFRMAFSTSDKGEASRDRAPRRKSTQSKCVYWTLGTG
jgi:hypothetical protein